MPDIDYSVTLSEGIAVSWATNPVSNDLSNEINTWLAGCKRSGKLNMTYNRYFNNRNPQNPQRSKYSLVKKGGVAVKFRVCFMPEVEVDVIVPYVRIFTVFFCQAHGIFHVSGTDVVGG